MPLPWFEGPDGPAAADRLAALLGAAPVRFRAVAGGYTPVRRAVVELADGTSAFVKLAVNELTAGWLRAEHRMYAAVGAPFMPRFRAFEDGDRPLLVLEDLSGAHWPPPWDAGHVEAARAMLREVAATPAPAHLPGVAEVIGTGDGDWARVQADPAPFLALGHVSAAWLEAALPALRTAAAAAPFAGDALLHLDVRSDNMCFGPDGPRLVDWNLACRGNPDVDVAFWLPSLHAEGGPPPEAVLPGQPELAAWTAGFFAARAGLLDVPDAPFVRHIQRVQLATALPWAIRALDLPGP